jgi:DNA-directed RNA polymerase subunit E'
MSLTKLIKGAQYNEVCKEMDMYRISVIEDEVRVPPEKLGTDVKKAVKAALSDQLEGVTNSRLGVVLSVISIDKVGEGKILPNDAGVYYNCEFKVLSFKPEMHEVVYGDVIDNTEFGAFIRMGPMDGLIHISQLMDDFVSYDNKNSLFLGKESKRTLKEGDTVRARVISVSLGHGENKIGLTMRQYGLGSTAWIDEEKKRKKLETTKAAAGGSKEGKKKQ